jgi:putative ABC transport system ATP-binding protein
LRTELSANAASCSEVVKTYATESGRVYALRGVDAIFPTGKVTAIVGPSGSGKSSLLRLLAGMDHPTEGSVTVGDDEISDPSSKVLRRVRRKVGYVFQRPSDNLISYLNVLEHVELAARYRRGGASRDPMELLDSLGLAHRADHRPEQLSGGEQQRVAFAQAVVGSPELVIADEPTAELDSHASEALLQAIHGLAVQGQTVVLSTHDPQAIEVADKTVWLRHGTVERMSEHGSARWRR